MSSKTIPIKVIDGKTYELSKPAKGCDGCGAEEDGGTLSGLCIALGTTCGQTEYVWQLRKPSAQIKYQTRAYHLDRWTERVTTEVELTTDLMYFIGLGFEVNIPKQEIENDHT